MFTNKLVWGVLATIGVSAIEITREAEPYLHPSDRWKPESMRANADPIQEDVYGRRVYYQDKAPAFTMNASENAIGNKIIKRLQPKFNHRLRTRRPYKREINLTNKIKPTSAHVNRDYEGVKRPYKPEVKLTNHFEAKREEK